MDAAYEDETGEIADFMAARLDEEQAAAEAAADTDGYLVQASGDHTIRTRPGSRPVARVRRADSIAGDGRTFDPDATAAHIVRHDPSRSLASIAADRAMLHEHAVFAGIALNDPSAREWANALGRMVRIRASAWAWHPEYKPGWKP